MTQLVRTRWLTVLMAASMLASAGVATAAEVPLRLVSVTGSGEVKAQPDMAYVTLGVEARRPTLAEARTEVNATVERIMALTRELKIEPKFVDSTRLQVQPDYRWDEKASQQVLLGYVVSRQVDVELHDLDRLGTLLEKSVSAGVNQVGGARLDSSRRKELERAALTQAVDDARLNADALASAAGAKLGPVQSLNTTGMMPVPMYAERAMTVAAAPKADGAAESYQPSEMKFTANVSAQFELLIP
ncbi:MAG: SIMPL domain-containing protein [Gammaproteobacteria bacterium]|nr:SIMPL domain-containing protein [Gammaproteobacteria bacterium]MDH4310006.1 SIMPL domain-containing protein [Gammaproteobacteria bacterium]